MSVVVDTSVWVHHFRHGDPALAALLAADGVLVHPFVLAELACGTPPSRAQTLRWLAEQRQPAQAGLGEVLEFVERERLYGLGCGAIDLTLLSSTLLTPSATLWTRDKSLAELAERFAVRHRAPSH